MRKTTKTPGEKIVKDIKRATRKHCSSEEKIRIVLDGLRGEASIAELCRREGISQGIYYKWSKDFMEAGKKRLAGDLVFDACPSGITCRSDAGIGGVFYGPDANEISGIIDLDVSTTDNTSGDTDRFVGAAGFTALEN